MQIKKDIHDNIIVKKALSITTQTNDSTAVVSSIIDMQGYDGAEFVILTGANTDADATFAVTMQESNDSTMGGSNQVDTVDMLGTLAAASFTFADDNEVRKIGYIGNKRYVTLTVTPTGNNSGNLVLGILVLLAPRGYNPATQPDA